MAREKYKLIINCEPMPTAREFAAVVPLKFQFMKNGFWFSDVEECHRAKLAIETDFPGAACEIIEPKLQVVESDKAVVDVVEELEELDTELDETDGD